MTAKRKSNYIGGITGFKALAALMVVCYHLRLPFAQGGLLGVTVFFVTSGFLITRNLLKEANNTGKINLGAFWSKRLRRIMPAVITMAVIVILATAALNRVLFTKASRDLLSVLFGYNNWWQIFNKVSYFENAGAPSPFTHTWSLAIELQFYLICSLIFFAFASRKDRKKLLTVLFAILSIVSIGLMWFLFDPQKDPSRVYYGTDTRIFSLLAGGLLALWEDDFRKTRINYVLTDIAGLASLVVLAVMMVRISGYSAFMYRGGQLAATLLSVLVVLAFLRRKSILGRVLSLQPFKWIGEHSYGIYLWHYPVILLCSKGEKASAGIIVLEILLTLLMTYLSYVFVENPVNSGMFVKWAKVMRSNPKNAKAKERQKKAKTLFFSYFGTAAVLVISTALCLMFVPRENALGNLEELEKQAETAAQIKDEKLKEREEATATEEPETQDEPEAAEEPQPSEETTAEENTEPVKKTDEEIVRDLDLLLIGDSVSLGAVEKFYEVFPNSICDSAVSRFATETIVILDSYCREHSWNGDAVIYSLGTNGGLYTSLEDVRAYIGPTKPMFVLTIRAPHVDWEAGNNQELKDFVSSHENTYLVDWYAASEGHPEFFAADDTHLDPAGAEAFVGLIKDSVLSVLGKHSD